MKQHPELAKALREKQKKIYKYLKIIVLIALLISGVIYYLYQSAENAAFLAFCKNIERGSSLESLKSAARNSGYQVSLDENEPVSNDRTVFVITPYQSWPKKFGCYFIARSGVVHHSGLGLFSK